jgi:hypothetical protein
VLIQRASLRAIEVRCPSGIGSIPIEVRSVASKAVTGIRG